MEHIHSKDIFLLIRDTLKLYDRRLMTHGSKVAYYVAKMLQCKGDIEEYELADIIFMVTLHDVGAYKTEKMNEMLKFETKDYHAHSLYGYLFLKNMSPIGELAKVLLYHHIDYEQLKTVDYKDKDLAACVNLAETVDIFRESLGDKFNLEILRKQVGNKFSPEAYELFLKADNQYHLFDKVKSKEYQHELDKMIEFFILPNHEKVKLLEFLMFTLSLKSEKAIQDAVTTLTMSEKLGILMGLDEEQLRALHYACYIHDIGMIAMPVVWLERQVKIAPEDYSKMKRHTILMEHLLKNRMRKEVIAIAATHHERVNGSGYPRKLRERQMIMPQMILQFADGTSGLFNPPAGKAPLKKERIMELIRKQAVSGAFNLKVAGKFLKNYDEIVGFITDKSGEVMGDYHRLNARYAKAMAKK